MSCATSTHYRQDDLSPFGMPFADATGASVQPYKYNNKELDGRNGLNWYDYSARYLAFDFPVMPIVDPMSEKYYSISPYVYCANNPIKYIDPTGKVYEEPVVWFHPSDENAKSMPPQHIEYKKGDNRFYVFGHGTPTAVFDKGTRLGNPKSINDALSKDSPAWKEAMEKGEIVTLYLYRVC